MDSLKLKGRYRVRLFDENKNLIKDEYWDNKIVNEGIAYFQSLAAGGSLASYYFSLYSGTYTPVATETAATYPTNAVEITSAYNETARPTCTLEQSGTTLASTVSGTFTFNATTTVKGLAILTSSTKGGTTGSLLSIVNDPSGGTTVSSGSQLVVDWDSNWSSAT